MKDIPVHELYEDDYLVIEKIESGERINFSEIHCHSFYEILYFTSIIPGDVHYIDFVEYPILSDHIYFIKPFQLYEMNISHQKGYSFALTRKYFKDLHLLPEGYINYTIPNDIAIEKKEFGAIKAVIRLILLEHNNKQRREIFDVYLKTLLTQLILSSKECSANRHNIDKRVFQLLEQIDKNFMNEHNTAFYSRQVCLSEKRLNELTKKALGVTVKQLISERLFLEAKKLIHYRELTFKEIAFNLGFNDSAYFSRFFKEQSGLSPEQFKQVLR